MRTIQEKYNAILEGNFSKTQFLRDAKRELSQFLSPYNGYQDTVQILRNKGVLVENFDNYSNDALADMIVNLSRYQDNEKDIEDIKKELKKRKNSAVSEAKTEKATNYEPTPAGLPAEAISRGIDYELEAIGVNTGVEMPTEEQLAKVTAKVNKNLAKNMNYYLDLIAGESKKVDKHDKLVAATKKNTVDTFNGMKKASLKESVLEKAMSKGYTKEQVEAAINNLKEKKGKDLDGDGDIDGDDYMAAKDKAIKGAMSEEYMEPNKLADLGYSHGEKAVMAIGTELFNQPYFNQYADGFIKGFQDNVRASQDYADSVKRDSIDEVELANSTLTKANQAVKSPSTLAQTLMGIYKQIQNKEQSDFSKHTKFGKVLGILQTMMKDQEQEEINEGRRRKIKGGKVVTENDYETGGYVESMGPRLDKALKALTIVWDEWKNGPATEPAMVPFAKKDLLNYIDNNIVVEENIEEDYKPSHRAYNVIDGKGNIVYKELPRHTAIEKASEREDYGFIATDSLAEESTKKHKELKEAFKAIISKVLTEEVITEAATGNLSKIADTYNDYEGMQTAVNALENIVTDVESYNSKTRDKIQKIYDSLKDIKNVDGLVVGSFLAPAIESAFRKDLAPVSQKGFTANLALPKTNVVKPGEVQEEELDEKETVFTPMSEITAAQQKNAENEFNERVNESRKTKYTKR